jgi:hypothetical protein
MLAFVALPRTEDPHQEMPDSLFKTWSERNNGWLRADSARARDRGLGSLGKVHASHQVLEARIIVQAFEPGIDLQQCHPLAMLFVGNFQPVDGSQNRLSHVPCPLVRARHSEPRP